MTVQNTGMLGLIQKVFEDDVFNKLQKMQVRFRQFWAPW